MSSKDKTLISDMMEGFVSEVPAKPFVTFCVGCNKGVISEDMMYEKGKVFHKDCYDKYGKNFPAINQDLLSQSTNAKVELVQLKNLKVRMTGTNSSSAISRPKTTKKSKRKTKKQRPKRRVAKRKRTAAKRRTTKKRTSRNRRISTKRTARRATSRTKRRVSKRRSSRRR
ncbi:MAG: LIM domain-containing protein [Nitrosopumilaceae archaeon]